MIRIAIDAGHGRHTAGKRVPKQLDPNQTREWVLNNRVVNYVEEYLKEYDGYNLLRTDDRTGKRDVPVSERALKANNFKADIFISVHHNAFQGKPWNGGGISVFRYRNSKLVSHAMAKRLYDSLIKETGLKGNRATPIEQNTFTVLAKTKAPALLIEGGFMDSKVDYPIISTEKFAKQYARGIVNWLVDEFKLKKKATEKKVIHRVIIDGKQVGAYSEVNNIIAQVEKNVKGSKEILIQKV